MGKIDAAFEVLGLAISASEDEVKSAFRERALLHHPDKGGDAERFFRVKEAYDTALKVAGKPLRCEECDGKRKVSINRGFFTLQTRCPLCKGTGRKER